MSWFDLILALVLFGFIWGGFWTGLIQSIGGLVGLFLGVILAPRFAEPFAKMIAPLVNNNIVVAKVAAFLLLFLLITRLVGVVFMLVNKIFNFIAIVPGLKFLNKLGGAVFGFLEGALFIGIALQYVVHLPIATGLAGMIDKSKIAAYLLSVTAWLVPLFPQVIKQGQNALNKALK